MNIREEIISIRQTRQKKEFIQFFEKNPDYLTPLLTEITELSPYPFKEYASWILVHLCKSSSLDIQPYYSDLVDVLFKTKDQTVLRNVVNCLSYLKIEDYRESELIDQLLSFIQEPNNKVALHVYSIYALIPFVRKYPELKSEVSEVIYMNERGKTAAYKVAKRNFQSELKNF